MCVCVGKGLAQCLLANKSYVMRSQPYWSNNKKIHIISWCQFLCVCIFACLYVPCAKGENRKKYNAENFCQITNHRIKKRREKNRKQEKSKTAHSWDIRTSSFFDESRKIHDFIGWVNFLSDLTQCVLYIVWLQPWLWTTHRKKIKRRKKNFESNFQSIVFVPFYGCNEIHFDVQTKRFTRDRQLRAHC